MTLSVNTSYSSIPKPACDKQQKNGFTLVELLVVIAIIGILAALLLPVLARAEERAKVVRVHAELYQIGLALEMYSTDNNNKLPPVRVNCNTDMRKHWCELPVELAEQGYLPHGTNAGFAINMEDIFNRGCTYKYAAPGPELMNFMSPGTYHLWVPTNAPLDMSGGGKYFTDPKISPIRWVVWSLGPQPNSLKASGMDPDYAPLNSDAWYRQTGGDGVIVRFAGHTGTQYQSP